MIVAQEDYYFLTLIAPPGAMAMQFTVLRSGIVGTEILTQSIVDRLPQMDPLTRLGPVPYECYAISRYEGLTLGGLQGIFRTSLGLDSLILQMLSSY